MSKFSTFNTVQYFRNQHIFTKKQFTLQAATRLQQYRNCLVSFCMQLNVTKNISNNFYSLERTGHLLFSPGRNGHSPISSFMYIIVQPYVKIISRITSFSTLYSAIQTGYFCTNRSGNFLFIHLCTEQRLIRNIGSILRIILCN